MATYDIFKQPLSVFMGFLSLSVFMGFLSLSVFMGFLSLSVFMGFLSLLLSLSLSKCNNFLVLAVLSNRKQISVTYESLKINVHNPSQYIFC